MLLPYKLYRVSLCSVLAAVVISLLAMRFRTKKDALSYSEPIPDYMLSSTYTYYNQIDLFPCTVKNVCDDFNSYLSKYHKYEASSKCAREFFNDSIQDSVKIFVKNAEGLYEINPDMEYRHEFYLKAAGLVLASAYKKGVFLNMKFDPNLLSTTFGSIVLLANQMPKNIIESLEGKSGYSDYCTMNAIHLNRATGKFSLFNSDDVLYQCVTPETLKKDVYAYLDSANLKRLRYIREGREIFVGEEEILRFLSIPELIENINARISDTEPLNLRNFTRYGLNHYIDDENYRRKVFQCLKTFSEAEFKDLLKKTTGNDKMPRGGAQRFPERIRLEGSYYNYEIGELLIRLPYSGFNCQDFKKEVLKTTKK